MKKQYTPLYIAVGTVVGIIIGTFVSNLFSGDRLNVVNASSSKLNDLLHFVDEQYVDTINMTQLLDDAIPNILAELDPHSSYITAKDAHTAVEDLHGSFSGVGIQFTIREDTVYVNNIVKGGPSEKVGILPGDRIIAIDGKPYVGKVVTNEETLHRLKGEKGSKVKVQVQRGREKKNFTIVRGDIPVKSIDATYMLTPQLGYIRINSFGETTYYEMIMALAKLQNDNFRGLVVDLRGNGGGYLLSACQLINEFLPDNKLIVYTEGRKAPREDYMSDGTGAYQTLPIIVLTDETSASASEIFAGAIQDNDRGIVVGRRTFGKGLVQQPFEFSDGSRIHLTIARYYTPSGRCIQKPYTKGHTEDYQMDIYQRYSRGEFFNEDSIRQTGEKYHTSLGRVVYGGGGIMPDYFVPQDTTLSTTYFMEAIERGLINEYCFYYTDQNRARLSAYETPHQMVKYLRTQHLIEKFAQFADTKGLQRRNNQIIQSQTLFEEAIYGTIIYNIFDIEAYLQYINREDKTVKRAIELFNQHKTFPSLNDQEDLKDNDSKKTARMLFPADIRVGKHYFLTKYSIV